MKCSCDHFTKLIVTLSSVPTIERISFISILMAFSTLPFPSSYFTLPLFFPVSFTVQIGHWLFPQLLCETSGVPGKPLKHAWSPNAKPKYSFYTKRYKRKNIYLIFFFLSYMPNGENKRKKKNLLLKCHFFVIIL